MITISLCMIVKNEEGVIKRCLDCVKDIVDEMIIVDTGSVDHTKEIVSQYTKNIYDFEWIDDFSKARNYSFSKAKCDYILWLDADDILEVKYQEELKKLKENLNKDIDIVMMKYQVGDMIFYRERLLKREKNYQWVNPVHEVIVPIGSLLYSDITIKHQKENRSISTRNLEIYEKYIASGNELDARGIFYYARELYEHGFYKKAISFFKRFLEREDAWVENQIEACLNLCMCLRNINEYEEGLKYLFQSFIYDIPRSEIICEIGYHYFINQDYQKAIYWYQLALKNKPNIENGGFVRKECYDFIPYIQLCVCFDKIGDYQKAYYYNEQAGQINSTHPAYLHNRKYLKTVC